MYLQVAVAKIVAPTLTFALVVPGDQYWVLRSVRAVATRAAGGAPNRAYTLQITNAAIVVAAIGADDAGAEPGTCGVTWANTPGGTIASGATGVSVAPLGPFALPPGYTLTGTIISPAAGDTWTSAVCWYDYAYTTPPGG